MRKQIAAVLLSAAMVVCVVPTGASAESPVAENAAASGSSKTSKSAGSADELTQKNLETIILAVKKKVTIPKGLTEFEYHYSAGLEVANITWILNWYDKDQKDSLTVMTDQKGRIVHVEDDTMGDKRSVPTYLKEELQKTAEEYIQKVSPELNGKYQSKSTVYSNRYNGTYQYYFERVENGIPMPNNQIQVSVDVETGKVREYYASWLYDVDIPPKDIKVTKEEAARKLGSELKMELKYLDRSEEQSDGTYRISAYLAYVPDKDYLAVDAKSGKIYDTRTEWKDDLKNASGASSKENADYGGLTGAEIKKAEEIKGLISKDKAISMITENKSLLVDSNAKQITATLQERILNRQGKEKSYVWQIVLKDPREQDTKEGDYYSQEARGTVDAVTGEILSYSASVKEFGTMSEKDLAALKIKYSYKECQEIFEKFAAKQGKDRFENTKLAQNSEDYVLRYENNSSIYGGARYRYNRQQEGIEYASNYIYGAVDAVTGKIYSYGYNWDNLVKFESPKNAMDGKKALDAYLALEGFELAYEINTINYLNKDTENYKNEQEIRLVYRTNISPALISPFTGKQLGDNGKEYAGEGQDYKYSDIKGHESERSIRLLAGFSIGFEGGTFKPDQAITKKELQNLIDQMGYWYYQSNDQKLSGNGVVNRELAAKTAVCILGFEKAGKLKAIYQTGYADESKIDESNIGYVALAKGFGLLSGDKENNFNPEEALNRAEAAEILLKLTANVN